jgi:hypothetical protein
MSSQNTATGKSNGSTSRLRMENSAYAILVCIQIWCIDLPLNYILVCHVNEILWPYNVGRFRVFNHWCCI